MVENVRLDDAMEELAANEAELAIDCSCRAAGEVPGRASVVRKGWVGVLKVGDRNWLTVSDDFKLALLKEQQRQENRGWWSCTR